MYLVYILNSDGDITMGFPVGVGGGGFRAISPGRAKRGQRYDYFFDDQARRCDAAVLLLVERTHTEQLETRLYFVFYYNLYRTGPVSTEMRETFGLRICTPTIAMFPPRYGMWPGRWSGSAHRTTESRNPQSRNNRKKKKS